jgi:hypothetical protein
VATRFAASASRHGISEDRARYVIEHCADPLYPGPADQGNPARVLFLGPDRNGIPLEVIALELADGDLLVIHAMKLSTKYRGDFDRISRWHEPT